MPLDKNTLEAKIKEAFKKAKETPPPDDPGKTDETQEEILTNLAADLADAIKDFVKSGDVVNVDVDVNVDVKDSSDNIIGTAVGSAGQVVGQPGSIE